MVTKPHQQTTPNYFHNSLKSDIYDIISIHVYDGNTVLMEIKFKNVGVPDKFNWFHKDNIEDIKIFDPVEESVIEAMKFSS
ncbi:hypothetical protein SNEBB_007439, partial [Seison nebaliae]